MTETTFLVLLSLCRSRHGYGIMQFIKQETGGRVSLGAGTLYGAVNALVRKKWIEATGNKKEYLITQAGLSVAKLELERLDSLRALAAEILQNDGGIS